MLQSSSFFRLFLAGSIGVCLFLIVWFYFSQRNLLVFSPDGESVFARQVPFIPSVIFHGDRTVKRVALTFDADMTDWMEQQLRTGRVKSYYDSRIPDILMKTSTPATFFLTGEWIEMYPDAAKVLSRVSMFELASHSYSHPAFQGPCYGLPVIPLSEDTDQIEKTQQLLENVAHVQNKLFRFPGGCYSKANVDVVEKEGLKVVDWDVVGDDAFNVDSQQIVRTVLDRTQNGSIIVLHLNGYPNAPATAAALPMIIAGLRKKGYMFVTVADMLQIRDLSQGFDYRRYLN